MRPSPVAAYVSETRTKATAHEQLCPCPRRAKLPSCRLKSCSSRCCAYPVTSGRASRKKCFRAWRRPIATLSRRPGQPSSCAAHVKSPRAGCRRSSGTPPRRRSRRSSRIVVRVELHPEARGELRAAALWYDEKRPRDRPREAAPPLLALSRGLSRTSNVAEHRDRAALPRVAPREGHRDAARRVPSTERLRREDHRERQRRGAHVANPLGG